MARAPRLSALAALLLAAACSKQNNVSVTGGGSGGAAGTSGAGLDALGEPCQVSTQCAGGSCVAGVCRLPCKADSECDAKSLCLADGTSSGCRLPSEATCDTPGKPCANAALVCGLDKGCRTPCTTSCARPGQTCIQGACVDAAEPGAMDGFFGCKTASGSTGKTCDGATLVSCNETAPGKKTLDTCATAALCASALAAGHATCDAPACAANELRCGGADGGVVQRCAADRHGFEDVDAAHDCVTSALCELTRADAVTTGTLGACEPPVCAMGASRCEGGAAKTCNAGRTGLDLVATCGGATAQCDPDVGQCITVTVDATEVTRDAYATFLAAIGDPDPPGMPPAKPPAQPPACKSNADFTPTAFWTAAEKAKGTAPVSGVDWCDAHAYCASVGRRLCGRIGGGTLSKADYADAGKSEWSNACTSAGANTHAFGAWKGSTSQETCNGAGNWLTTDTPVPLPVGSKTACVSSVPGYVGTSDLTGNVAEWEDACDASADTGTATDGCRVRGGSYLSETSDQLACAADRVVGRSTSSADVGFRCCK